MTIKLTGAFRILLNKYSISIIFLHVVLILTEIQLTQSIAVSSSPVLIHQPQYIESQGFKFLNIPVSGIPNTPSSSSFQDYSITFSRIHLIQPFNYDVAISLTGLGYVFRWQNVSANCTVSISIKTQNPTDFVVTGFVEYQTNFIHLSGRYLAYNKNYLTDFYFDKGLSLIPTMTNFPNLKNQFHNKPHPSVLTGDYYYYMFMLEGIDQVLYHNYHDVLWQVQLISAGNQYQILISGKGCWIIEVFYTIIYFKTTLLNNQPPFNSHTKIFILPKLYSLPSQFDETFTIYDTSTDLPSYHVFDGNYMLGINQFEATDKVDFEILSFSGQVKAFRIYQTSMKYDGFLFYGYKCLDGFYFEKTLQQCIICPQNCLQCNGKGCLFCDIDYVLSLDGKQCNSIFLPSQEFVQNCLYFNQTGNNFVCLFCNITRKLYLNLQNSTCQCQFGYAFSVTTEMCQDICGDGLILQSQCDDGNKFTNDGCDIQCKIQVGFICQTNVNPTVCKSALQLKYKIDMILKLQDEDAGTIILSPTIFNMPFDVIKQNFFSNDQSLTHLDLNLIIKNNSVEKEFDLDFELQKVENNKIYILFRYNFTVQKLNARIYLNYEHTKYIPSNQTLDFQLTGLNAKFQFTQYYEAYNTVSKGIMTTTLLGLLGLVLGLFLPKFIGIETIVTMQLIFYSQVLIFQSDDWPVGFFYLKYLKIATGYNDIFSLTSYVQLTNITKKFFIINLKKTIIENFNINFVVVILFAVCFYLVSQIRSNIETEIEDYIKVNKIQDAYRNFNVKKMVNKLKIPLKINQALYWIISQLCVWSVLPIISCIGGEFLIQNSMITIRREKYDSFLLGLRGIQFFIILFVVLSIVLSHVKNAFLSKITIKKIKQRPEELLYKRLLFIYLFVVGGLIFFFNDVKLGPIPTSVVVLFLHTIYAVIIVFIKPYKQSLRIHAFVLYMNQILYGVFLIVINLINLVDHLDEVMILYIGYGLTGWIAILILLTFIRLYYEIRYGQALEIKIQAERQKKKEQQKKKQKKRLENKINILQKQAKERLTKQQQKRDKNEYLLETQQKQTEKKNLLEWLEGKNWQKSDKQKYFFKEFHQKPLEWIKNKDSDEFKKRIAEIDERNLQIQKKKRKQKEDPKYIEVTDKLRESLQTRKKLLKSFRKEAKMKGQLKKWNKIEFDAS